MVDFPQWDLRYRGGADFWDQEFSGNVQSNDYFTSETIISLNSVQFEFVARPVDVLIPVGGINLNSVNFSFSLQTLQNLSRIDLNSISFPFTPRALEIFQARLLNLTSVGFNIQSVPVDFSSKIDLSSRDFSLNSQSIDTSLISGPLELNPLQFKFQTRPIYMPIVLTVDDALNGIIYLKLTLSGYSGKLNDMLYAFFGGNRTSLNDREYDWLVTRTGLPGLSNSDLWNVYLESLGYSGSLNNKLKEFWINY